MTPNTKIMTAFELNLLFSKAFFCLKASSKPYQKPRRSLDLGNPKLWLIIELFIYISQVLENKKQCDRYPFYLIDRVRKLVGIHMIADALISLDYKHKSS